MANTYTSLIYHIVFSTKNRDPWLTLGIEQRIWSYIGGIARKHRMTALQVGGVEDHIHCLVMAPTTLSPSQIAQLLKGNSSNWIHEEFPALKHFGWQDGYAAFTVSKSNVPEVVNYIRNQRQHHRKKTFKEEYLEFLIKNGISMTSVTCGGNFSRRYATQIRSRITPGTGLHSPAAPRRKSLRSGPKVLPT